MRISPMSFLIIVTLLPFALHAAETPASPPPEAASDPEAKSPEQVPPVTPAADDFNFDLFGTPSHEAVPAPDPELLALANQRRSMLIAHQAFGLATLAAMATTVILGKFNYDDLYGAGGDRSARYLMPHRIGAYGTAGLFLTTASLSLLAPEPYEQERSGFDSGVAHRILVGVASAGMLTQLALGFITARRAESGNPHLGDLARAHRVVGVTTLGVLSAAALVWVF